ncbi:MAG: (2Fe-2S)-binding protein [Candidatus Hydrogenedentes bacterium]|nr:(2Fe-2S)-binding protein [Candidatus Hydrogenedentota bacterium]
MADSTKTTRGSGLSRRGFLKGISAGGVATGLVGGAAVQHGKVVEAAPAVVGPGDTAIKLKINGEVKSLTVEPRTTLLDALRNRLDITGAKKVCDRGTCGACTLWIDGQPAYACSVLAIDAEDSEITTIESLGTPERMTALQQAFVNNDAQQCGFCTPGMIMACEAFLKENPSPTRDQVRDGISGNLCRCGTYHGIIDAVLEAAKTMKGGA